MLWVVMSWLWRLFLSVDVNAVLTQDPTPEVSSSLPESSSVISVTLNIRFLSGWRWTLRSRQRPTCSRVGRTGASGALDCVLSGGVVVQPCGVGGSDFRLGGWDVGPVVHASSEFLFGAATDIITHLGVVPSPFRGCSAHVRR